ncbi:GNAT family N-acetyltransferase [Oceanobacillus sp. FSL K6-2867]|uniref:GNAT family N-acetyltransferase n=1 Tax=Oceanobacillus sp. FSL K6-2867 TaxID=2954748 RepID=UPI0030D99C2C
MIIRKATIADAEDIAKVHVDSWKIAYKGILPDEFLNRLSYEQRTMLWERNTMEQNVYIAENAEGKIVGFSIGDKERTKMYDGYEGELNAIYILKAYQRRGIGKLLIQPVVEELLQKGINTMIVKVIEENPSSVFYEALGAHVVDRLEIKIAGALMHEIVYGWDDLKHLQRIAEREYEK